MRACDRREDDPREELLREEVLREEPRREEVLPEDALRGEAPREDLTELLLPLADLDAPLLLELLLLFEPLVLLELPVEPLLDLLLPDRTFAEDDRAPDEREELLLRDLPLDLDGMGISFSCLLLCDEFARGAGCQ
jgi:hypothetical protein